MISRAGQTILTPSQVGQYVKNFMDHDRVLSRLLVRGEISNYKKYPSGHHYFTLKDGDGALRCVMFRGDAASFAASQSASASPIFREARLFLSDVQDSARAVRLAACMACTSRWRSRRMTRRGRL